MCRATVGELYVPSPEVPAVVLPVVVSSQQPGEEQSRLRNSRNIITIVSMLACIIILIVIIRGFIIQ
jgi:hypothetical protein